MPEDNVNDAKSCVCKPREAPASEGNNAKSGWDCQSRLEPHCTLNQREALADAADAITSHAGAPCRAPAINRTRPYHKAPAAPNDATPTLMAPADGDYAAVPGPPIHKAPKARADTNNAATPNHTTLKPEAPADDANATTPHLQDSCLPSTSIAEDITTAMVGSTMASPHSFIWSGRRATQDLLVECTKVSRSTTSDSKVESCLAQPRPKASKPPNAEEHVLSIPGGPNKTPSTARPWH